MPSDYGVNWRNKGNAGYPRFLERLERGRFRFVGLQRISVRDAVERLSGAGEPPPQKPHRRTGPRYASPRTSGSRLFVPSPDVSLRLNVDVAARAIRAYNSDRRVLAQELQVLPRFSDGFARGRVLAQIRALNSAYSTRASGPDLEAIASAIEAKWPAWQAALAESPTLGTRAPSRDAVITLLGFFLGQKTRKQPRSLATKALHFAAPQRYAAADTLAVDFLGAELVAPGWKITDGMDCAAFAEWYLSYLQVLSKIGADNADVVRRLVEVDRATASDRMWERWRGFPKILDKVLWWTGREMDRGNCMSVFAK